MEPTFGGLWERLGVSLERLGAVLGRLWGRLTIPDSVNVSHVLVWFGAGVRFGRGFFCLFVFCVFLCVLFSLIKPVAKRFREQRF